MDLTIIIPALNEAGNIGELVRRARGVLDPLGLAYEILVMDGASTDATCAEAEAAGARATVHPGKGYGAALRCGFAQASGDYVLTMDSDLSHEPEFIETLWGARQSADVVIASRYVPGGTAEMSRFRYALSRILNTVYTFLLQIPVRDMSSGFRIYRRQALDRIELTANNFDVLEEILIKLYVRGCAIREAAFDYRPRKTGKSHAKLLHFAVDYVRTLWTMGRLRYGRK